MAAVPLPLPRKERLCQEPTHTEPASVSGSDPCSVSLFFVLCFLAPPSLSPSRLPHLAACLYPALSYLFQFVHFANANRVPRDNLTTRYMMEQYFLLVATDNAQNSPARMEKALVPDPKIMEILSWQKRGLKSLRKKCEDFVSRHPRRSGVYRSY